MGMVWPYFLATLPLSIEISSVTCASMPLQPAEIRPELSGLSSGHVVFVQESAWRIIANVRQVGKSEPLFGGPPIEATCRRLLLPLGTASSRVYHIGS